MAAPQPLINAAQVAGLLGLGMRTIRSMTRRHEIPGAINVTPASNRPTWRYSPSALERWIQAHSVGYEGGKR